VDEDTRAGGSPVSTEGERSQEEIRADIEETRAEVGDTVEALAEKTDVKGQAQQRVAELKGRFERKREDLMAKAKSNTPQSAQHGGQQVVAKAKENRTPLAIGGAVLLAFLIGRRTGRP
jgi:chromosome segregation ATPase